MRDVRSDTYDSEKNTFSVSPVRHAAMANMKVVRPKEAWIGTRDALKPAVAPSQHKRIRKLKKPTTNCQRNQHYSTETKRAHFGFIYTFTINTEYRKSQRYGCLT